MTETAPSTSTGSGDYPGKTFGIVALIVAIIAPLIGLILGFVANNQSKNAGHSNGFAKAAIWVGAILTVLSVILWLTVIPGLIAASSQIPVG